MANSLSHRKTHRVHKYLLLKRLINSVVEHKRSHKHREPIKFLLMKQGDRSA